MRWQDPKAARAIIEALHNIRCCVRTITDDNGSEFAERELIEITLDSHGYFAEPHSPWQRGTNESPNGLIRQYLPKGKSMGSLTDEMVQTIEDKLNSRPRKVLEFKTPREVLLVSLKRRTS